MVRCGKPWSWRLQEKTVNTHHLCQIVSQPNVQIASQGGGGTHNTDRRWLKIFWLKTKAHYPLFGSGSLTTSPRQSGMMLALLVSKHNDCIPVDGGLQGQAQDIDWMQTIKTKHRIPTVLPLPLYRKQPSFSNFTWLTWSLARSLTRSLCNSHLGCDLDEQGDLTWAATHTEYCLLQRPMHTQ